MWVIQGEDVLAELPDETWTFIWLINTGYTYDLDLQKWHKDGNYVELATELRGEPLYDNSRSR